jgi:hypothetical protein
MISVFDKGKFWLADCAIWVSSAQEVIVNKEKMRAMVFIFCIFKKIEKIERIETQRLNFSPQIKRIDTDKKLALS